MANQRSIHRPISVNVESISRLPNVRELPTESELTVNLRLNQKMARELALFLLKEILIDEPLEIVAVSVTGTSR